MKRVATTGADLVPISRRLQILRLCRLAVVTLVAAVWAADPAARGVTVRLAVTVTAGYVLASLLLELAWRAFRPPDRLLLGALVMGDALYLAWASYGTAGLGSPVCYLILLQLTTVSLIASWRTGVKLAAFSSLLLVSAYYAGHANLLARLGNPHVRLGGGYRELAIQAGVFWLIAIATSTLAAINERELRRRRYDLEALARLALHLDTADDARAVGTTLLSEVADAFGYERGMVLERRQGQLVPLAWHGLPVDDECAWVPVDPAAAPVVTAAIEHKRTVLASPEQVAGDAAIGACATTSRRAIVVPLHAERAIGALVLEHGRGHGLRVERRVVSMLERFCSHTSLALSNVNLLMPIRNQATTDTLTGLANRRALDEALQRARAHAMRSGEPLSLAVLDIDHFKAFNDTHGHQLGDRVLQLVGSTLAAQTRAGDIAGRYGGEEFCVLMPGTDAQVAAEATRRLCAAITSASGELAVTASGGVACLHGEQERATDLFSCADAALYAAKRAGRNRVEVDGGAEAPPPRAALRAVEG